ncbi:NADPH-dependent F420 reductase [Martelella endophytica]|uniref:NADP oxidoreductase n=1 Tax=Martelella endophytica TaxID=1486262 RepID=A0A0D5LWQ8_MAREN|nr:NAD(P)-binding domain-containing protein [Martelella endophytica]AJY48436.1 NADP oxidoreductase [Martelella endophytica]
MKIGIIGAGYVGRAVGKKAVETGHDVMLSNSRGPQTLMSTIGAIGCKVGTMDEAIAFGDVIVIAIPLLAYEALPAESLAGKIVIDAANYYFERDGHIEALDKGETTTSEMMAAHLKEARLVKAFNSIRMIDLDDAARPKGSPERVALPLAGEDADAKAVVSDLYDQFGYDTVDAGPLSEGWRFERNRPTYCVLMPKEKLAEALAATTRSSWQGQ